MKLRLHRPRELARALRAAALRRPEHVEEYLDDHVEEWTALAAAAPADAADILERLPEDAAGDLLAELTPMEASEVLEEIRPGPAADILEELPPETAAGLVEELDPEDAADLIAELDPGDATRILDLIDPDTAAEINRILTYPADSAGGLMTTDVATLPVGLTAGEAIERIRQLHEELENLSYVYVVDDAGRLEGVVSFRDLVFARPGAGLDEVMVRRPATVGPWTDREEVSELLQRYHLMAVPVVDNNGILLGIVTTDTALEAVAQEASEDFAAAMGAGIAETVRSPIRVSVRARLPWISFDVLLSSSVVVAVSAFSGVLGRYVVLAALMPLVARIGGDAGAQALAVVIRALASDEIPPSGSRRAITREVWIGTINGVVVGLLAGVIGAIMETTRGGGRPIAVATAMVLASWMNLVLAGLAGSGVPLALRRMGFDPALGSNLFLTTFTDLLGFAGFLAVATVILG